MAAGFQIVEALDPGAIGACRDLLVEYQRDLGVSLCFQGFDRELAALPGDYAPPRGRLLIAMAGESPAGCVALRPLGAADAEMKRLYVRAAHRGRDLGRALALRIAAEARSLGYRTLKLDTLPSMAAAQKLYGQLGFVDVAPYNDNPVDGVRFMALDLSARL
jgi:GNAT superfamily N-acetyltransferase